MEGDLSGFQWSTSEGPDRQVTDGIMPACRQTGKDGRVEDWGVPNTAEFQ
jgi:hypothetical protein